MRRFLIALPVFLAALAGGCATNDTGASAANPTENCIRVRAVRSYDALDDRHVWVEENSKRQFLLTLWAQCPDMRYARAIAFTELVSVCPNSPGSINFSDGNRGYRCEIRLIERVASRAEAEAVVDDRMRLGD